MMIRRRMVAGMNVQHHLCSAFLPFRPIVVTIIPGNDFGGLIKGGWRRGKTGTMVEVGIRAVLKAIELSFGG